jgi:hypothetical protein
MIGGFMRMTWGLGLMLVGLASHMANAQVRDVPTPDPLGASYKADTTGTGIPKDYDFLVGRWDRPAPPDPGGVEPCAEVPGRVNLLRDREAIWHAWFTNDEPRLQELLPTEVIAINNGDSTWHNRATVLSSSRAFVKEGGRLVRLKFPRTECQVFGAVAILYSLFEMEFAQGGTNVVQQGRATEIFILRGAVWQNSGWHLDSGD